MAQELTELDGPAALGWPARQPRPLSQAEEQSPGVEELDGPAGAGFCQDLTRLFTKILLGF